MAGRRMITDQDTGVNTFLPESSNITDVVLGLSVHGELVCSEVSEVDRSPIVLPLWRMRTTSSGHWILPSDLACFVNKEEVETAVLVSYGSLVEVGDRTFLYGRESSTACNSGQRPPLPPPRKPARMDRYSQQLQADIRELQTCLDQSGDTCTSIMQSIFYNASSLINQCRVDFTGTPISKEDIDRLCCSFRILGQQAVRHIDQLMKHYYLGRDSVNDGGDSKTAMPEAIIHLLTQLLKESMADTEEADIWLRLLAIFSAFTPAEVYVRQQVAPVASGTMAVFVESAAIQQQGSNLLAHIATYRPSLGEKIPLREGTIDVLLKTTKRHCRDLHVQRAVCSAFLTIVETLAELANQTLSACEADPEVSDPDIFKQPLFLLDYIKVNVLPEMEATRGSFGTDDVIHQAVTSIFSFYESFDQTFDKHSESGLKNWASLEDSAILRSISLNGQIDLAAADTSCDVKDNTISVTETPSDSDDDILLVDNQVYHSFGDKLDVKLDDQQNSNSKAPFLDENSSEESSSEDDDDITELVDNDVYETSSQFKSPAAHEALNVEMELDHDIYETVQKAQIIADETGSDSVESLLQDNPVPDAEHIFDTTFEVCAKSAGEVDQKQNFEQSFSEDIKVKGKSSEDGNICDSDMVADGTRELTESSSGNKTALEREVSCYSVEMHEQQTDKASDLKEISATDNHGNDTPNAVIQPKKKKRRSLGTFVRQMKRKLLRNSQQTYEVSVAQVYKPPPAFQDEQQTIDTEAETTPELYETNLNQLEVTEENCERIFNPLYEANGSANGISGVINGYESTLVYEDIDIVKGLRLTAGIETPKLEAPNIETDCSETSSHAYDTSDDAPIHHLHTSYASESGTSASGFQTQNHVDIISNQTGQDRNNVFTGSSQTTCDSLVTRKGQVGLDTSSRDNTEARVDESRDTDVGGDVDHGAWDEAELDCILSGTSSHEYVLQHLRATKEALTTVMAKVPDNMDDEVFTALLLDHLTDVRESTMNQNDSAWLLDFLCLLPHLSDVPTVHIRAVQEAIRFLSIEFPDHTISRACEFIMIELNGPAAYAITEVLGCFTFWRLSKQLGELKKQLNCDDTCKVVHQLQELQTLLTSLIK